VVKALFLTAGLFGALGCSPSSNICNQTLQPLLLTDGGPYPCTRGDDCPRGAETYVCTTTGGLPPLQCVSCDGNACTLHVPVACQ